jgi:hypothetical protein
LALSANLDHKRKVKPGWAREPVVSVDTKRREQLGRLPMGGRGWRLKGEPVQVEDHNFDHDTTVFAVESIRRWWKVQPGRMRWNPIHCLADRHEQAAPPS